MHHQARFISLIKEKINVNVISYEIYNEFDVTKKKERDGLLYKGRRNGELSYSPSFPPKLITHDFSYFSRVLTKKDAAIQASKLYNWLF